jgi:hypothetical protein
MAAVDQMSCQKIADQLNRWGIPCAYVRDERRVLRGKRKVQTAGIWRPGRVRNLIISTTYKGEHEYGKRAKSARETITRPVPAIVSPETWEKAQQTLSTNFLFSKRSAKHQAQSDRETDGAAQLKALTAALAEKVNERDRIISLFRKGRIDQKSLDRQLDELHAEEATLQTRIDELGRRALGVDDAQEQMRTAEAQLEALRKCLDGAVSWEVKHKLVEALVAGIRVNSIEANGARQNHITVTYRFNRSPRTRRTRAAGGVRSCRQRAEDDRGALTAEAAEPEVAAEGCC